MKFHIIDFHSACVGKPTDGATKFAQELPKFLEWGGISITRHNFSCLLQPSWDMFGSEDIIFSAAGPYAYLYHYWRNQVGLDIPIIRDIHGGVWNGYLMQEWLCSAFTRPGDIIIFPSEFARSLYTRLFPETAAIAKTIVAHPLFTNQCFATSNSHLSSSNVTRVGLLSRLSHDKNVLDLLKAVAILQQSIPYHRVEMHVIGGPYDLQWDNLYQVWKESGGEASHLIYWGCKLPQIKIEEFYQSINVLGFFSTSNIEALGRVVVEAQFWNVPVCMARHAAADELVSPRHQVPVQYFSNTISCSTGLPMGTIDPKVGAEALNRTLHEKVKSPMLSQRFLAPVFVRDLRKLIVASDKLYQEATPTIADDWVINMPSIPSAKDACLLIEEMLRHLKYWSSSEIDYSLNAELLQVTTNYPRTEQFLSNIKAGLVNYADTTGYPFHLAQLARFHPTVIPNPVMQ
jgi:glycosyltransferase involved in cell wall biosynthesis